MKKLCALILALVMALSLAAPAMAADQPLWQQMGYESQQDLMTWYGLSQANYDTIAAQAADFDPYAYYIENEQEFWGMIAQDYMAQYDMTEEEFRQEMLTYWFASVSEPLLAQQAIDEAITAAGGVLGQTNVMWNGMCIQFTDAIPEITNNRTMVPVRAIMENLGAEVTYGDRTVTCTLNGATVTFTVGAAEATVERDGETETVALDSPSYIKNNRTYVPLRFISELSGYDVFWDKVARTAVIVDREATIAALDENLTILNDVMRKQYAQYDFTKAYQFDYNLDGSVDVINTLNGNKTYTFAADMGMLWKGSDYEITGSLDLGDVIDAFLSSGEITTDEIPEEALSLLREMDFSMILSGEGYWISAPVLTYVLAEQNPALAGKDVWVDVGAALGMDMRQLMEMSTALMTEDATIGSVLYDSSILSMEMLGDMRQLSYLTLPQTLGYTKTVLDTILGDDTFTKSGTSYKWSMDNEDLVALSAAMGMPLAGDELEGGDFSMEMTVRPNGSVEYDLTFALNDYNLAAGGYTDDILVTFTMSGTSGALNGDMDLRLQVKNVADAKITLDYTGKTTTKTPASQPPAGAEIQDLYDL